MKARIIKVNYSNGYECFKIQFKPIDVIEIWFTPKFIRLPDDSKLKNRFNMLDNAKPYLIHFKGQRPIKTVVFEP